jgi:hypothetical protein
MSKIPKELCKLSKKQLESLDDTIRDEVASPKYICRKCVRVSSTKKLLCKATKLRR